MFTVVFTAVFTAFCPHSPEPFRPASAPPPNCCSTLNPTPDTDLDSTRKFTLAAIKSKPTTARRSSLNQQLLLGLYLRLHFPEATVVVIAKFTVKLGHYPGTVVTTVGWTPPNQKSYC